MAAPTSSKVLQELREKTIQTPNDANADALLVATAKRVGNTVMHSGCEFLAMTYSVSEDACLALSAKVQANFPEKAPNAVEVFNANKWKFAVPIWTLGALTTFFAARWVVCPLLFC